MGCRSKYWRTCGQPAASLQLMAGSLKKPVQLPVIQLLERVGKVSWQHVSRRQFFGAAHDRTGLLGGCQACRSVGAKRLLSACRDWLAGVGGLELRDVVAKYPFESSHRFPVIQPNSGRREYSRSSCDGGRRSSGPVPGSRQDACAGRNCRDFLPIPFGLPASVALPPCGE